MNRKRVAPSMVPEPLAKRPCLVETCDAEINLLDIGFYEYDGTDNIDEELPPVSYDDLDHFPIEVLNRIVAYTKPKDGLDDSDLVSLSLVNKRRNQMCNNSTHRSTLRVMSKEVPSMNERSRRAILKMLISSSEEERIIHATSPLSSKDLIHMVSNFSNLLHLSLDIHKPDYEKMLPQLPTRLESLHLSSWATLADYLSTVSYVRSWHVEVGAGYKSTLETSKEYSFAHLTQLKRLSLFSTETSSASFNHSFPIPCNKMSLPSSLETLHMPQKYIDLSRRDEQPLSGWSNLKTLGVAGIHQYGDKMMSFYLPLLKTFVSYTSCQSWYDDFTVDTIIMSYPRLASVYLSDLNAHNIHFLITTEQSFAEKSFEARMMKEDDKKVIHLPKVSFFYDTLKPINVCKPGPKKSWLPQ